MDDVLSDLRVLPRRRDGDSRGWLLKVAAGPEGRAGGGFAEAYVVEARPGAVRGHHYHRSCREWFTPIRGSGRILLEDPGTGQQRTIVVSGDAPVTVEVPPGVAHALEADPAGPLWVVAVATHPYDPRDVVAYRVSMPERERAGP